MKKNTIALAIAAALAVGLYGCNSKNDPTTTTATPAQATATSVSFSATPVAATDTQMLDTYTTSVATVTYSDGSKKDFPLAYNTLFNNTDLIADVNGTKYRS